MDDVAPAHPSDRALSAFGLGKLDERSAEAVDRHLEDCPDCRKRVAELTADSFLVRARDARALVKERSGQSQPSGMDKLAGANVAAPPASETLPPGLADHPDYEIKRELGRGGMGVVYLAHNKLMGRDDALKVMGRHIIERPRVLERFLREIRAVARLRHPNIVAAYNATRLGQSIVLAMEYVEGLDLARSVSASGPLPVAHACYFIYQAALGLQHAHEEGLVHRDVKPSNLMLSSKGGKDTVKILDFGLAKATREEKLSGGLTWEGQALGTPDFIAPEQIVDAPGVDIRADVYSLGGTLYYLLTGRPPFQASCVYDIYQAHISRDADPLNLVRPEVPTELATLVAKMMAKDPARRFQTPGEVAQALMPFFVRGTQAFKGPKPDVSLGGEAAAHQLMTSTLLPPAQPEARADTPALRSEHAGKPDVTETPWDALIAIRDRESLAGTTLPVAPTRHPPRARLALTAGVLTLALLAVWLCSSLNDMPPSRLMAPRNEPSDSTGNHPSSKAGAPLRSMDGPEALAPPRGSGQPGKSADAKSKAEFRPWGRGDAEHEPEVRRDRLTAPRVAGADTPSGAGGGDQKADATNPAGGPPLPESIALDLRLPMMEPRSAGTKATPTRKRPEPMQLETAESKLKDAKKRYERAMDQASQKLLEAFENAIRNVDPYRTSGAVGRQVLQAQLSKEKERFLKDHGALPNTAQMFRPVIDYLLAIVTARAPLSRAYEDLVALNERTDPVKARQLALEADTLQHELREAQPLDKHSVWEGNLSYTAGHMPFSLRILDRQDIDLWAEVVFNGGTVKVPAKGHCDGLQIAWSTDRIPDGEALVDWNFRGIVWRGRLFGHFEYMKTDAAGERSRVDRGQIDLELKQ